MDLAVPDHIAFCFCAERSIFLDIKRDRYFTVAPHLAMAFKAFVEAAPPAERAPDLEVLVEHGLLARATAAPAHRPVALAAQRGFIAGPASGFRPDHVLAVATSILATRKALTQDPFHVVISRLRARRTGDPSLTRALCARFLRYRALVPIPSVCLLDSIALLAFLEAGGGQADLVFGVSASPFTAHCWLQQGDEVLNDALDRVTPCTPILVV